MKYSTAKKKKKEPLIMIREESSEYSPNKCVFRDDESNAWLYHANCIEFMDMLHTPVK